MSETQRPMTWDEVVAQMVVYRNERDAYQAGEKAWKDAVIDQLVILHIYQAKHDADPYAAVQDLLNYSCQLTLDPQVSSDAAALVQAGRDAMKVECAAFVVRNAGVVPVASWERMIKELT